MTLPEAPPPCLSPRRDSRGNVDTLCRSGLWTLVSALALTALVAGAACTRRRAAPDEAPDVLVSASFSPSPPVVGEGQLTLSFADRAGVPTQVSSLDVKADMTHPGMRPWLAEVESVKDSQVTLAVEWSMAGDWLLQIEAELGDGRRLRRTLPAAVEPAGRQGEG